MAKKYIVAAMLAAAIVAAWLAIRTFSRSSESVRYDVNYTWYAEYSQAAGADVLIRGKNIGLIRMDVNKLVEALNRATQDMEAVGRRGEGVQSDLPKIILRSVERQTASIEIANDRYLSEAMGSSGAQAWLAGVTYTLTENPGIKAVDFSFTPGEHALPGVYTRESFRDYKVAAGK